MQIVLLHIHRSEWYSIGILTTIGDTKEMAHIPVNGDF